MKIQCPSVRVVICIFLNYWNWTMQFKHLFIMLTIYFFQILYWKIEEFILLLHCLPFPQIDKYESLHDEMENMSITVLFDNWCRLDVSPFKHTLLSNIKQWAAMFKQYLIKTVTSKYACLFRVWSYAKDYYITLRANPISCAVGLR